MVAGPRPEGFLRAQGARFMSAEFDPDISRCHAAAGRTFNFQRHLISAVAT
jgi:hypothetical protein